MLQKEGDWQHVLNKLQNDGINDEYLTKKMIVSVNKYVVLESFLCQSLTLRHYNLWQLFLKSILNCFVIFTLCILCNKASGFSLLPYLENTG